MKIFEVRYFQLAELDGKLEYVVQVTRPFTSAPMTVPVVFDDWHKLGPDLPLEEVIQHLMMEKLNRVFEEGPTLKQIEFVSCDLQLVPKNV